MESIEQFRARVEAETGVSYAAIPAGVADDIIGGQIICCRGDEYVVTSGYPDRQDADGADVWDPRPDNFRRVDLGLDPDTAGALDPRG